MIKNQKYSLDFLFFGCYDTTGAHGNAVILMRTKLPYNR